MGSVAKAEILEQDANGNTFVKYAAGDVVTEEDAKKYGSQVESQQPADDPVVGIQVDDETGLILGDTEEGRKKARRGTANKAKPASGDKSEK